LPVVPNKFRGPIDDHLGSVSTAESKMRHVRILTVSQKARRVRIFPAVMIPIVNMLTEHDQAGARHWLLAVQILEESVRRRTAGASLGREKLHHDWRSWHRAARSGRGGLLMPYWEREHEKSKEDE